MLNHAVQTHCRKRVCAPLPKRILMALARLSDKDGQVKASAAEIAYLADASPTSVKIQIHQLEAAGEIQILSKPRAIGAYTILHLPTYTKPNEVASIRTEIVDAIRVLSLPKRVRVIFQALARYASKRGNNIFPSRATLARDTGYSSKVVAETLRWLLTVGLIEHSQSFNKESAARPGYCIPGWDPAKKVITVSDDQMGAIKALHRARHGGKKGEEYQLPDLPELPATQEVVMDDDEWEEEQEPGERQKLAGQPETPAASDPIKTLNDGYRRIRGTTIRLRDSEASLANDEYLAKLYRPKSDEERLAERLSTSSRTMRNCIEAGQKHKSCPISMKQYHTAKQRIAEYQKIVESGEEAAGRGRYLMAVNFVKKFQADVDLYESYQLQAKPVPTEQAPSGGWVPAAGGDWVQLDKQGQEIGRIVKAEKTPDELRQVKAVENFTPFNEFKARQVKRAQQLEEPPPESPPGQ